jgi:DNA-binding transcriptional regulator YdaS (Cro superfamily)
MNTAMVEAARVHGGYTALAKRLGVKAPSVHEWASGRRSVPPARCVQIERVTGGAVMRWDLRDDWAEIWPELIGREGAPKAPASEAA